MEPTITEPTITEPRVMTMEEKLRLTKTLTNLEPGPSLEVFKEIMYYHLSVDKGMSLFGIDINSLISEGDLPYGLTIDDKGIGGNLENLPHKLCMKIHSFLDL